MKYKIIQKENKDVFQSTTWGVPEYPMDRELWDILLHIWLGIINKLLKI